MAFRITLHGAPIYNSSFFQWVLCLTLDLIRHTSLCYFTTTSAAGVGTCFVGYCSKWIAFIYVLFLSLLCCLYVIIYK
jgi:hypothetical protein